MKFIDLSAQQQRIKNRIATRIQAVLTHGQYIMGPEVKELEERLAEYVGVTQAIGCASGTDALLLALLAYNIGPGDVIFTTPFTFIATTEVVSLLGATPIFVDIDPQTFNLDPDKLDLAILALKSNDPTIYPLPKTLSFELSALSPRGIIAVDLFGLPADYDRIKAIAKKNGLFVIEDAAQSFGAEYYGKKACALSEMTCTSFFPAKPLGGYGDGGMCFTNDDQLAQKLHSLRNHGQGGHKYENIRIGINGRLDTLQAAILLAKFEIFPEEIELRQQVAQCYSQLLSARSARLPQEVFSLGRQSRPAGRSELSFELSVPHVPTGLQSAWAQYSLLTRDEAQRSLLQAKLKEAGIPTAIYYPKPLHLQTAFAFLGYKEGDFPISEDCAKRIFSLPMHPYLKPEDQERIVKVLERLAP